MLNPDLTQPIMALLQFLPIMALHQVFGKLQRDCYTCLMATDEEDQEEDLPMLVTRFQNAKMDMPFVPVPKLYGQKAENGDALYTLIFEPMEMASAMKVTAENMWSMCEFLGDSKALQKAAKLAEKKG